MIKATKVVGATKTGWASVTSVAGLYALLTTANVSNQNQALAAQNQALAAQRSKAAANTKPAPKSKSRTKTQTNLPSGAAGNNPNSPVQDNSASPPTLQDFIAQNQGALIVAVLAAGALYLAR